jgi:hypothetical protein
VRKEVAVDAGISHKGQGDQRDDKSNDPHDDLGYP